MKQILCILIFCGCCFASAQQTADTLTLHFSELQSWDTARYGLPERPTRLHHRKNKTYVYIRHITIKRLLAMFIMQNARMIYIKRAITLPPALQQDSSVGVMTIYLKAEKTKKSANSIPVIIGNVYVENPVLYIDRNCNFNFTDDGEPITLYDRRASLNIAPVLPNGDTVKWMLYAHHPQSLAIAVREDELKKNEYDNAGKYQQKMARRIPIKRFPIETVISVQNIDTRFADTVLHGKQVRVVWNDFMHNGVFTDTINKMNDDSDLLFLPAEGERINVISTPSLSPKIGSSFALGGNTYAITAMHPQGRWLKCVPTAAAPTYLHVGGTLPLTALTHLDNKTTTAWSAIKDTSRYTLVDVWGSWCKGCIASMPDAVRLDSLYGNRVQIIGISTDSPETLQKTTERFRATWQQFHLTKEVEQSLHIFAFPTYILVDKKGTIVKLGAEPQEVERMFRENKLN